MVWSVSYTHLDVYKRQETKLYTKADVNARKAAKDTKASDDKAAVDELSQTI